MWIIAVVSETVHDRAYVSMSKTSGASRSSSLHARYQTIQPMGVLCAFDLSPFTGFGDSSPFIPIYASNSGRLVAPGTPEASPAALSMCLSYRMFVQASSIISTNIYPKEDAPMCAYSAARLQLCKDERRDSACDITRT